MSSLSEQLSQRIKEVYLSGTWIARTNYKAELQNVPFNIIHKKINNLNSIAQLTIHAKYYVSGIVDVLNGKGLHIKDANSFNMPLLQTEHDWQLLLHTFWSHAEDFAQKVSLLTSKQLFEPFVDEKYGNYYRNIEAMIEHGYYHLGQIVLIKKIIFQDT